MTGFPDVAIIGGGIVGCAAAAFLSERGARVELFERAELAGAASGRNSGVIQHPFEPVLAELHVESLRHYRGLEGFDLPDRPAGILMLGPERARLEEARAEIARTSPELEPALLDPREVRRLEPARGPPAVGLPPGDRLPGPAGGGHAGLRRARAAGGAAAARGGARVALGDRRAGPRGDRRARALGGRGRARGRRALDAGGDRPQPRLAPDRARVGGGGGGGARGAAASCGGGGRCRGRGGRRARGRCSAWSWRGARCRLARPSSSEEPDPGDWALALRDAGARFVPALAGARVAAHPGLRPAAVVRRPSLVGPVPGLDGVWAAAGHGPWGISAGPATARVVADALLGRRPVPAVLDAGRAARV